MVFIATTVVDEFVEEKAEGTLDEELSENADLQEAYNKL